jgi:uncharacterized protein YbbK (DUF523 family)
MKRRLKLGISGCLVGENVRYDGSHKLDQFIIDTLGKHVEFVPVCPEMECGFGVPREPFRLEGDPRSPRLVTIRSREDSTERLLRWSEQKVHALKRAGLCGFVFKSGSPSCGMEHLKVHSEKGRTIEVGMGIFARIFMEHFPLLAVADEVRLHVPTFCPSFIERLQKSTQPPFRKGDENDSSACRLDRRERS